MAEIEWHWVCEADPRVGVLYRAGLDLVIRGADPDVVYGDAKPLLAAFVGWNRGRDWRPIRPTGVQHALVLALAGTQPPDVDHEALRTQAAFRVACEAFHDGFIDASAAWSGRTA